MVLLNVLKYYRGFDQKNHDWPQVYTILLASLGGFTSSILVSWTSPSIPILISNSSHIETITMEEASYLVLIPSISTLIATPFVAIFMNIIGRKKLIILMAVPHMLSLILVIFAKDLILLYISRAVYGLADAVLHCVVPTYVGEIAQPHVRGSWGNLFMISVFCGQFLINVVGAYCNIRTTALIFLPFPIVHFVLMLFAPESPYFLLMRDRKSEAEKALKWLRWNNNVKNEFDILTKDVYRQISESGTLKDLFIIQANRKALLICIALRAFQQFSGFTTFAVYTQYIFSISVGNLRPSESAIIFTAMIIPVAAVSSFLVGKFGRRPLLMFSSIGCSIGLFVEAAYFYIVFNTNLDVSAFTWTPLAGMLWYIITSTAGLGILPTLMVGELFSASIKNKAVGILCAFFSLCIIFIPKLYQWLSTDFSPYLPFLLFGIITIISAIFVYFFAPETKSKTLEEVQQMLTNKKHNKCQTL